MIIVRSICCFYLNIALYLGRLGIIFFFLFSVHIVFALGENSKQLLSLNDIIRLGLQNNLQYQSKNDEILAQKKQVDAAKASWYYPSVSLNQNYLYQDDIMPVKQALTTTLSINKVLFAFGKFHAKLGEQQEGYAIAKLNRKQAEQKLIKNLINLFYQILSQKKAVQLAQDQLHLTIQEKNEKKLAFQEGRLSKRMYLNIQTQWKEHEMLYQQQHNLLLAQTNELLVHIGLPTISHLKDNQIPIRGELDQFLPRLRSIDSELSKLPPTRDTLLDKKIKLILKPILNIPNQSDLFMYLSTYGNIHRNDIKILERRIRKLKKNKVSLDSSWKPTLSAHGKLELRWTDPFTTEELDFVYNIGLQLSIPLFELLPNSASRSNSKSISYQIKALQKHKQFARQTASKEIRLAIITLQNTIKNLELRQHINQLAYDSLRITKKGYQQGVIDRIELKKAQLKYQQTQSKYYQDCYSYYKHYVDLVEKSGIDLLYAISNPL